jgi:hypothetical protein
LSSVEVSGLPGGTAPSKSGLMVKALQDWLNNHELPAIIAGVLGVVVLLSLILVVGGYWLVTR